MSEGTWLRNRKLGLPFPKASDSSYPSAWAFQRTARLSPVLESTSTRSSPGSDRDLRRCLETERRTYSTWGMVTDARESISSWKRWVDSAPHASGWYGWGLAGTPNISPGTLHGLPSSASKSWNADSS